MTQFSVIPAHAAVRRIGILRHSIIARSPLARGRPLRGRFEYWFLATQLFLAVCHVGLQGFLDRRID